MFLDADAYLWVKALHIISVIAWMAGLFYLPRLFVYHAGVEVGSAPSETFKIMEGKLLRIITTPAMIASWLFGLLMFFGGPGVGDWIWTKYGLLVILVAFHVYLAIWARAFAADENRHSGAFFRKVNEIPTVLMVGIVFLAVLKPF